MSFVSPLGPRKLELSLKYSRSAMGWQAHRRACRRSGAAITPVTDWQASPRVTRPEWHSTSARLCAHCRDS